MKPNFDGVYTTQLEGHKLVTLRTTFSAALQSNGDLNNLPALAHLPGFSLYLKYGRPGDGRWGYASAYISDLGGPRTWKLGDRLLPCDIVLPTEIS